MLPPPSAKADTYGDVKADATRKILLINSEKANDLKQFPFLNGERGGEVLFVF